MITIVHDHDCLASGAQRIALQLADLADQARRAGFAELGSAIDEVGIEAAEEARHALTLQN